MVKISLINTNLIQEPAVAPYALDILATALAHKRYDVNILDLTPNVTNWSQAISSFFSKNLPDFVGISLRNVWDLYFPSLYALPEQGSFIPSHKQIIDKIAEYMPKERVIAGGVGFSSMPQTVLDKTGLKYGIIGPGETILPELIQKLSKKEKIDSLPFVFIKNKGYKKGFTRILNIPINRTDFVDNKWYYKNGEHVALRTTNGCNKNCTYCFEKFGKGNIFRNSIENIVKEIDQLISLGVKDIHFANSEGNIPFKFSKEVANAIIQRKYPEEINFWSYEQPYPFDKEYAILWKKAGMKGMLFGTDHTNSLMLRKLGKWYDLKHIRKATKICNDLDIKVMHELLFGMYGETMDSMKKSIELLWSLKPHVIGTTLGIGITPLSPLANHTKVRAAIKEEDEKIRTKKYGIHCKGIPLQDPTYLIDPSIKIPEAYDELAKFVGSNVNRIMVPTIKSNSASDNQLVGGDRIKNMKRKGLKGAHWYWYPLQFE